MKSAIKSVRVLRAHIPNRHRADDRGFALISVLIASAFIAILALTIMSYLRAVADTSALFVATAKARSLADAGLTRILIAFSHPDDSLRAQLKADGRPVMWQFHGRTITLSVQAESGKIDLNAGDLVHIHNLLSRLVKSDKLRAFILTYIDAARQSGRRIESVAEILPPFERMGAFRDVMSSYFTVLTNQIGIDAATAPVLTLETMPGLSIQTAHEIKRTRDLAAQNLLVSLTPDVARRFVPQRPIYTLRAEMQSESATAIALQAVVKYNDRGRPAIFAWGRSSMLPASGEMAE